MGIPLFAPRSLPAPVPPARSSRPAMPSVMSPLVWGIALPRLVHLVHCPHAVLGRGSHAPLVPSPRSAHVYMSTSAHHRSARTLPPQGRKKRLLIFLQGGAVWWVDGLWCGVSVVWHTVVPSDGRSVVCCGSTERRGRRAQWPGWCGGDAVDQWPHDSYPLSLPDDASALSCTDGDIYRQ